jgi:hypothetical protein
MTDGASFNGAKSGISRGKLMGVGVPGTRSNGAHSRSSLENLRPMIETVPLEQGAMLTSA